MAEEDFSDLGEVKLTHYDGHRWTSGWGRSPGSGIAVIPHQYPRTFLHSYQNNSRPAEAEDIMGRHYSNSSRMHQKSGGGGLYYSPPGTSYTIVEKPFSTSTMSTSHPQSKQRVRTSGTPVTVTASSSSAPNSKILSNSNSNKKRPISPEQVLKLFSAHTSRNRHNNNCSTNSYNVNNSNINSNNTSKSTVSTDTYAQQSHRYQPPDIDKLPVKTITMTRDTPSTSVNQGFGICVKGGCSKKTDNVGVYISRVEEGSIAEKSGLRPGDSILEVNGIPFTNISHDEALKILKSCRQISMTIRMSPLTRIEGCWVRQSYSWMDRMGRQVSPPPDYSKVTPTATSDRWPPSRLSKEKVRKVELNIEPGQSLGLMIRGGSEYNLGIFVTGVDKNSVADRAGIQIGDQILDVNGTSFLDISHDNAVEHLKKHKRMTITIRDVGKIPHSISTFDSNPSVDCNYRGGIQPRVPRLETNNMQMVEEKATSVLKKCEYATLCYYLEEYCSKRMTFETFIAVLFDLLNSPEKFTLMTELREIVNPHDRSRFDEIVYRGHSLDNSRNYYNMRERLKGDTSGRISPTLQNLPPTGYANTNNYLNEKNIALYGDPDEFRSPSEDSGLGLGPQDFANNRISRDRNSLADSSWQSESRHLLEHQSHSIEDDLDYNNQEYGDYDTQLLPRGRRRSSLSDTIPPHRGNNTNYEDANMCGYLEGIRSQLGGWTQKVKDWYWGNPFQLAQKLGRGCDIKDEKDQKTNAKKEGSTENAAHIVPDQYGNLRITVKKTKPLLGIAIEGGVNTKHPLPRIINIHENGAAFEAGGLEVGQLILEVDRQKVEGMQHQAIARLIAETYANRDRKEIEFLVIEAKKSNLEPKPTALIFMDS